MKIAIRVLLVLLVVVGVGIWMLSRRLDDLVKRGIETFGPSVTKVTVAVGKVNLSPLSGSGRITGFALGNPPGYKTPTSITWDAASIDIAPASLLGDEIVIHSVRITNPLITYETRVGTNNLRQLADGIAGTGPSPPPAATPGRKIVIKDLLITGGRVRLASSLLGGAGTTLSMPDIHLTDLGEKKSGMNPAMMLSLILGTVTETSIQVATGTLKDVSKVVKKTGRTALNTAETLTGGATDALKDTGKGATDAVKKGLKGVGGLLK